MTIEDARSLIAEAEADIANVLNRLCDEVGIIPRGITFQVGNTTVFGDPGDSHTVHRVRIEGMEL